MEHPAGRRHSWAQLSVEREGLVGLSAAFRGGREKRMTVAVWFLLEWLELSAGLLSWIEALRGSFFGLRLSPSIKVRLIISPLRGYVS